MKWTVSAAVAVSALAGAVATMSPLSGQSEGQAAPIYGIKLPQGYRDWHLISVKQLVGEGGKFKQLRAELGNDIAIAAYRDGYLRINGREVSPAADDLSLLLLEQAQILDGELPEDPAAFAARLNRLVLQGVA